MGSSDCPGWSRERYLIGVGAAEAAGAGTALERATNRAYAALARQIKVGVTARLWVAAFESARGMGERVSEELEMTARILLEGAEVGGRWTGHGEAHVLVALDRRIFAERAAELGARRAASIEQLIDGARAAKTEGRQLDVVRTLSTARCFAVEGERRWEIARLVAPRFALPPPAVSAQKISLRLARARAKVRIVSEFAGVGEAALARPAVRDAVLHELTRLRLSVAESAGHAEEGALTLRLVGQVTTDEPKEIAPSLYVARANARLKLLSPDGQMLFAIDEHDKGGGEQRLRAQTRALELLAPKVAAAVRRALGPALGITSPSSGCEMSEAPSG